MRPRICSYRCIGGRPLCEFIFRRKTIMGWSVQEVTKRGVARKAAGGTVGLEGHLQPSACETSVECDNEGGGIQKSLQSGLFIQVPSLCLGASRYECRRRRCAEITEMRYFAVLKMVLEITAGRARVENNYGRRASDIVSGRMPRTSCGKCSRPAGSRPRRRSAAGESYRVGIRRAPAKAAGAAIPP